jgi:hypothetical protein
MSHVATLTGILILATLAESLVEYLVRPLVKPWGDGEPPPDARYLEIRTMGLRYVAALVGVILCALYRADLLAIVGLSSPWAWTGQILTGLIIGRGANFVHDFASRWLSPAGPHVLS